MGVVFRKKYLTTSHMLTEFPTWVEYQIVTLGCSAEKSTSVHFKRRGQNEAVSLREILMQRPDWTFAE